MIALYEFWRFKRQMGRDENDRYMSMRKSLSIPTWKRGATSIEVTLLSLCPRHMSSEMTIAICVYYSKSDEHAEPRSQIALRFPKWESSPEPPA
jgi:hypothetical protein